MEQTSRRFFSASMIVGLLAAVLVFIGMLIPMLDMSAFHEKIQIKYNIFKVCENVGLLSPSWKGVPSGMLIGVVAMVVLSFVDIPLLKLIPTMIILAMFIIMLADMGNIINWAKDMIHRYFGEGVVGLDNSNVLKSFSTGIYFMVAGIVTGIISCFCPGRKEIQYYQ